MLFPLPSCKPLLFLGGSRHLVTPLFLLRVSHLGASGSFLLIRSKTSFYKQLRFLLHPYTWSSWWLQHVCWWVLQQWTLGFLTFSYCDDVFFYFTSAIHHAWILASTKMASKFKHKYLILTTNTSLPSFLKKFPSLKSAFLSFLWASIHPTLFSMSLITFRFSSFLFSMTHHNSSFLAILNILALLNEV